MVNELSRRVRLCVTASPHGGAGIALYRRERFDALILD